MSREWKPGDVAMAHNERVFMDLSREWRWVETERVCLDQPPYGLRPLVVIDPEDREAVERLHSLYESLDKGVSADDMQAALREYANPKPPKPDEPGTWGVVKASCVHSDVRREWVKFPSGNWHSVRELPRGSEDIENPDDWDSLIDPELVRDGVDQ